MLSSEARRRAPYEERRARANDLHSKFPLRGQLSNSTSLKNRFLTLSEQSESNVCSTGRKDDTFRKLGMQIPTVAQPLACKQLMLKAGLENKMLFCTQTTNTKSSYVLQSTLNKKESNSGVTTVQTSLGSRAPDYLRSCKINLSPSLSTRQSLQQIGKRTYAVSSFNTSNRYLESHVELGTIAGNDRLGRKDLRAKVRRIDFKEDEERPGFPYGPNDVILEPEYNFILEEDKEKSELVEARFGDIVFGSPFQPRLGTQISFGDREMVRNKMAIINEVAVSLLRSPNFKLWSDETRQNLSYAVDRVLQYDPEFILKVALYTRKELNIRTTANFLVSYAALHDACRPFLRKYFQKVIALPTDWIEVAELYQCNYDNSLNFGSLPSALRRVMVAKFPDFDEYQLAKYNREKKKAKKRDKTKNKANPEEKISSEAVVSEPIVSGDEADSEGASQESVVGDPESDNEEEREKKTFTLKQLVRKLHINEPVYHVMCLLGKRYPSDPESFRASRLPGTWDEGRIGKRMKLAVPETWETQVSSKGNKAKTWETLIAHRKLPYMAMLRNIRNLLKAGISPKFHRIVIRKLTDEGSVINSKQFPLRFLSAFEVLDDLEKSLSATESGNTVCAAPWGGRGRGMRGRGRGKFFRGRKGKGRGESAEASQPESPMYDVNQINEYRKALESALKTATAHNLQPIPGTTLIILACDDYMVSTNCQSARGFGKPRSLFDVAILMSLMCKSCCEDPRLLICNPSSYVTPQLNGRESFLANVEIVRQQAKKIDDQISTEDLNEYLARLAAEKMQVDNVLLLESSSSPDATDLEDKISGMVSELRQLVNKRILYVRIDLSGGSFTGASESGNPLDVSVSGYSDQILRFVAERGSSNQLTYVENIDFAYQLMDIKVPAKLDLPKSDIAPVFSPGCFPVRKAVRIFISSTFKDMHGERDLLTRFVFPEIRARAAEYFIDVYEVDLRWGITEQESNSERQIEICLAEVAKADLFVGLLGDRYGWIPDEYNIHKSPEFDWLDRIPKGKSITELEMMYFALLDPENSRERAFFFLRDEKFLCDIPDKFLSHFQCENAQAREQLSELKGKIISSGFETFRGYPCHWTGVVEGKPMVAGLEEFGTRVLNNLWGAIKNLFIKKQQQGVETEEEESCDDAVSHVAYAAKLNDVFVGRKSYLKMFNDAIQEERVPHIVLVTGKNGCGKSSLMANLAQAFKDRHNFCICFFVDALREAHLVSSLLRHLCQALAMAYSVEYVGSDSYGELRQKFHDLLKVVSKKTASRTILPIFIDGVEKLDLVPGASLLDWLPSEIPKGILFVMSCVENGSCQRFLADHQKNLQVIKVGPMSIFEGGEMVRKVLKQHRKVLDESAFNNQMKILLSKREANSPTFLKLACEEIRLYGIYEKVSDYLRTLPQTANLLIQSVLQRLEEEFGADFVSMVMAILFTTRQGLTKEELFDVVCIALRASDMSVKELNLDTVRKGLINPEPPIPLATFARFCRSIQGYLSKADRERLCFSTGLFKDMVWLKYVKGDKGSLSSRIHKVLAGYYKARVDPSNNGEYDGKDRKAFSELIYHLTCLASWEDLRRILCSLKFIAKKFEYGIGLQLLEDFSLNVPTSSNQFQKSKEKFLSDIRVSDYKDFIVKNMHVLDRYPALLLQQASNEPNASCVYKDAVTAGGQKHTLKWISKPDVISYSCQTFAGFSQHLMAVALAPDDQSVACGSDTGELRLFDRRTGKELKTFLGHSSAVSSVCFVGVNKVCSASWDGTLSLWDVHGGHRLHLLKGHQRRVVACTTIAGSKKILSASWDSTARIWNSEDGKEVMAFKGMSGKPLNCCACSGNGHIVALGGWNQLVVLWDIVNNKRLKVLKGHLSSVQAVAFSKDSSQLVSSSIHGEIILWSVRAGVKVGQYAASKLAVTSLKFTKDNEELLSAGNDTNVKVWSGSLGQPSIVPYLKEGEERNGAVAVALNAMKLSVAVGYHSGTVITYDLRSGKCLHKEKIHASRIHSIAWSRDGKLLLTGSEDKTAKVFMYGMLVCTLEGHEGPVRCVRLSDAFICTASEDHYVRVWNAIMIEQESRPSPLEVLQGHKGPVTCCSFSSCGTKLASGGYDGALIIWDLLSFNPLFTLEEAHKDWINCCAWSDIGDYVVTGSNDFNLKVWDAKTGAEKFVLRGNASAINSVDFKFGCIVSVAYDGMARVWTQRGAEISAIRAHEDRINTCQIWAPRLHEEALADLDWEGDDTEGLSRTKTEEVRQPRLEDVLLLTGSDDGLVKLWRPFMPHLRNILPGHTDFVTGVDICSNENAIVTSSYDKTLRLWRQSKDLLIPAMHDGEVTSIAVNENGTCMLSSGRDGKIILWEFLLEHDPQKGLKGIHGKALEGSKVAVTSVQFLVSSNEFVSGDVDGALVLWGAGGADPVSLYNGKRPITKVETLANDCIAMLRRNDCVVFNRTNGTSQRVIQTSTPAILFRDIVATAEKKSALLVGSDDVISVLFANVEGTEQNKLPYTIQRGTYCPRDYDLVDEEDCQSESEETAQQEWNHCIAVSHSVTGGDSIVAVGDDKGCITALLGHRDFYKDYWPRFEAHDGPVTCASIWKSFLVTGSKDRTIKVWDLEGRKQVGLFFGESRITGLKAFTRNDSPNILIVYGDSTGRVELLIFRV